MAEEFNEDHWFNHQGNIFDTKEGAFGMQSNVHVMRLGMVFLWTSVVIIHNKNRTEMKGVRRISQQRIDEQ